MRFRRAGEKDVEQIVKILRAAAERMLTEGKRQWAAHYTGRGHVVADIRRSAGYVLEDDGGIVAYGAFVFDGEPAYEELTGEWLSEGPYVVVHQISVSGGSQRRGVGVAFSGKWRRLPYRKAYGVSRSTPILTMSGC